MQSRIITISGSATVRIRVKRQDSTLMGTLFWGAFGGKKDLNTLRGECLFKFQVTEMEGYAKYFDKKSWIHNADRCIFIRAFCDRGGWRYEMIWTEERQVFLLHHLFKDYILSQIWYQNFQKDVKLDLDLKMKAREMEIFFLRFYCDADIHPFSLNYDFHLTVLYIFSSMRGYARIFGRQM